MNIAGPAEPGHRRAMDVAVPQLVHEAIADSEDADRAQGQERDSSGDREGEQVLTHDRAPGPQAWG